jgi:hypothetical protein
MNRIHKWLIVAGMVGGLVMTVSRAHAQGAGLGAGFGGGNFNPAQFQQQMQQMMLSNYRDQLEVTNDTEWVIIQERIKKVLEARQDTGFGGMGGMAAMFGRGQQGGNFGGGGQNGLAGILGTASPEEKSLQNAVDNNAANAVLKAGLTKLVEARKAKQAKLEKAQDDLRSVLSVRQEAIAALSGLL